MAFNQIKFLLFTFLYIIANISTTLGQATPPAAVQPSPSAIAPSPIATGDITACSTCDKVKAACGSKFSLPQVDSQGTYIATDKCYCNDDVYNNLSQCLICCNSANVGNSTMESLDHWKESCISLGYPFNQNNTTQSPSNTTVDLSTNNNNANSSNLSDSDDAKRMIGIAGCSIVLLLLLIGIVIIVRRHRKARKIGDYNISNPTKTKSLDILDNYNRKTRYSNRSVDQFKENDVNQKDADMVDMVEISLNDNQQQPTSSPSSPNANYNNNEIPQELPQEFVQFDDNGYNGNDHNVNGHNVNGNGNDSDYPHDDHESIGQAIIPMAVVPEIINIIPEVHIIDENSINFSDNFNNQFYYSSEQHPYGEQPPYV